MSDMGSFLLDACWAMGSRIDEIVRPSQRPESRYQAAMDSRLPGNDVGDRLRFRLKARCS
jgi:hypothetical protein